jgi:hypothetical protein
LFISFLFFLPFFFFSPFPPFLIFLLYQQLPTMPCKTKDCTRIVSSKSGNGYCSNCYYTAVAKDSEQKYKTLAQDKELKNFFKGKICSVCGFLSLSVHELIPTAVYQRATAEMLYRCNCPVFKDQKEK